MTTHTHRRLREEECRPAPAGRPGAHAAFVVVLAVVLFGTAGAAPAAAITGREIAENIEARESGETTHALVNMRLVDEAGRESTRVIEQYGRETPDGLLRNVIIFHQPASVQDTRFLTIENDGRDDDQWIYLPGLRRVRRIAAGEGSNSFMGTDFSYDDLKSLEIDDYEYELLREETLGDRPVYVVEVTPIDPDDSQYSRVVQWVDRERWLPLRMELFDHEGELLKVNTVSRVERVQGFWTVINNTMENVQTGHRTELAVQRFVYNENLPDGLFTTNFLERGRP
jgi:outer membrane lipoprotein-sorting protein